MEEEEEEEEELQSSRDQVLLNENQSRVRCSKALKITGMLGHRL